jgi:hypothetical protein
VLDLLELELDLIQQIEVGARQSRLESAGGLVHHLLQLAVDAVLGAAEVLGVVLLPARSISVELVLFEHAVFALVQALVVVELVHQ